MMSKLILFLLAGYFGFVQKTPETKTRANVPPVLSAEYKQTDILGEATGDLDKDGIPEKVVVYTTDQETDEGYVRALHIYKKKGTGWEVWQTSENAVLKSEEGGMMGDPFEGVAIEKGILKIYHFGGSSWKWSQTHKYRFQNGAFYLIGVSNIYGKPCEYFSSFDYNLSIGKISYKKEYEECDEDGKQISSKVEEEDFTHKLAERPTLSNISFGNNQVVSRLSCRLRYTFKNCCLLPETPWTKPV